MYFEIVFCSKSSSNEMWGGEESDHYDSDWMTSVWYQEVRRGGSWCDDEWGNEWTWWWKINTDTNLWCESGRVYTAGERWGVSRAAVIAVRGNSPQWILRRSSTCAMHVSGHIWTSSTIIESVLLAGSAAVFRISSALCGYWSSRFESECLFSHDDHTSVVILMQTNQPQAFVGRLSLA